PGATRRHPALAGLSSGSLGSRQQPQQPGRAQRTEFHAQARTVHFNRARTQALHWPVNSPAS
ncbi:hypothetical protein, partial [Polaromonas sp.]|uniref:hypothetical protein n=1 Tax=Polaromonas sp. TaxID=1869339 RepID=UPI0025F2F7CA